MAARANSTLKSSIRKELTVLAVLVFIGMTIVPLAVYLVGQALFGEYGGGDFTDFFRELHADFRGGRPAAWLLLLAPYIVWQLIRATARAFRRGGQRDPSTS